MTFEDADKGPRPVFLPPRDSVTAMQMNVLLSAARVMYSCAHPPILVDAGDAPKEGPADGGARLAAEQTFVRICDRIDRVMADESRWDMKERDSLEKDMSRMLRAQTEMSELHKQTLSMTQLPQFKVKPLLVKLTSEVWAAYLGDITNRNDSIVALGSCPQSAMNHFDKVYLGVEPERMHQDMLDQVLEKTGRTRNTIINEIKMDTGEGRGTDESSEPEGESDGDSGDAGHDPESN